MSVTRVAVSSQPKIDAAATMNSTVAVVSMVSIDTLTSILNVSVRYQKRPEEQRPDRCRDRALGRREDACGHPADQQHRRHDRQHRLELPFPVGREQRDHRDGSSRASRIHSPSSTAAPDHQGNAITMPSSSVALPTRLQRNLMSAPQLFLCA